MVTDFNVNVTTWFYLWKVVFWKLSRVKLLYKMYIYDLYCMKTIGLYSFWNSDYVIGQFPAVWSWTQLVYYVVSIELEIWSDHLNAQLYISLLTEACNLHIYVRIPPVTLTTNTLPIVHVIVEFHLRRVRTSCNLQKGFTGTAKLVLSTTKPWDQRFNVPSAAPRARNKSS